MLTLAELRALRDRLKQVERPWELQVVLYEHQLHWPVAAHLALCDKVTFWTWQAERLEDLEVNFLRFERLIPEAQRRTLGCYMWDYGGKRPLPPDRMERQCELALCWLEEGRLAGVIFLASCICDLDLEAVAWTRRWLDKVGDRQIEPLGSTPPAF